MSKDPDRALRAQPSLRDMLDNMSPETLRVWKAAQALMKPGTSDASALIARPMDPAPKGARNDSPPPAGRSSEECPRRLASDQIIPRS